LIDAIENSKESFEDDFLKVQLERQGDLEPRELWGPYLRAPTLYFEIVEHPLMTDLGNISRTRIGLQTFADKFYILSKETAQTWGIEKRYLKKIITSPRLVSKTSIDPDQVNEFVLVCSDKAEDLQGRNIQKFIEWGEELEVEVRKKETKVKGFHQLPRVQIAKRKPWYNLQKEIDAKGIAPILYPYMAWKRIIFVWNPEGVIDHQNFVGIIPKKNELILPLLAVLNSSLTEFVVRCISHIYGGGVAKLRPSDIRGLRILDIEKIKSNEREHLSKLFLNLVKDNENSQKALDDVVFNLLKLNEKKRAKIMQTIEELKRVQQIRKEVNVLVETAEKWKPRKKPRREKLSKVEPSKRLDTWMRQ